MRQRKENGPRDHHQDLEGQLSKNDRVDSGENKELPEERNAPLALGKKTEKKTNLAQYFSTIQKVLHPERRFLQIWNTIFVVSCVIAVSVDPLFFYIPVVNEDKKCIAFNKTLRITAICLRSVTDLIYVLNIVLQFHSPYINEDSRKFGRAKLVTDASQIASRYLRRYFLIDIFAILPIPQVVISIIFSKIRGSNSLDKRKLLNAVVLLQYVPRIVRIYLSWQELTKTASKIARIVWVKAGFNFFLYILASHVLGAFWYFFSIERETACWHVACKNHIGCVQSSFNCDTSLGNYTFINGLCPANTTNTTDTLLFDFGIFLEALQSGILESTDFPQKFLHCFWWGLRNLSSLGQNLQTSVYFWENCFAVLISIFGLLLFLCLIGNFQTYMQLATERSEEVTQKIRVKKGVIELWMHKNKLPVDIKGEILSNVKHVLEENKDVDVESLFPHLPIELRKDIKCFLCLPLLKKVPMFQNMGDPLLQSICHSLKPVYYNEHNYIVREGEPLDVMLFITQGIVWTYKTSDGERSGSLFAQCLEKGDLYGEELLDWGLKPNNPSNQSDQASKASSLPNLSYLPNSTKTVKSHTKVEAFALMANDLKPIVSRWQTSILLRRTETEAASALQAAWRRRPEKKPENTSPMAKGRDGNWLSSSWCFKTTSESSGF